MPTFKQIAAKTAKLTLQIEGDEDNPPITVTIVYYPNKFTAEVAARANSGDISDKEYFPTLIKSWDIYEDEEETVMVPIEHIDKFGVDFKQRLARAIGEDLRPNLEKPQNGNKPN